MKTQDRIGGLVEAAKGWMGVIRFEEVEAEYRRDDAAARLRAVSGFAALADKDGRALRALFDALWDPSRDVQRLAMEKLFTNLSPHIYDDFVVLEQVDEGRRFDFIHRRYVEIIRDKLFAGRALSQDQVAKVGEAVGWKYPRSTPRA